jgi:hypothetical protein
MIVIYGRGYTNVDSLGIERLYDPLALARANVARSMMASSYDRRGGNHDWSNYVRVEDGAAVLMEAQGPGCITRFWTADPQQGTVRIFIDGRPEPAIETRMAELFRLLPLSFGIGGEGAANYERSRVERLPMGHTSYCPIPFQHACKVTIDPEDDYLYYQINYHLLPPGTEIRSFDSATSLDTPEIRRTASLWSAWQRQEPLHSWSDGETGIYRLAPDETAEIFARTGAGVIHGLRISLPAATDAGTAAHIRDNLWLTAHFDDDELRDPSVRAPVGPLCLDFGQAPAPRSLLAGTDAEGGYYLFFAMPYARSARLRLVNRSLCPLADVCVSLLHEAMSDLPADLRRFRAAWHIETPFGPDHRDYGGVACRLLNLDGRDNYELLNVRGAGQFVGCGFHIDLREAPTDRAACEGDEMFFVDDDPRLTLYGTGTEDYLNDAWGLRGYDGPLSGDAILGTWGANPQLHGYRLHLSDSIPFVRKGRFTLEHGTGNNCSGLYRSIAYWYLDPASNRTKVEEARWEAIRNRQS